MMSQYWTETKDPTDVDYYEVEVESAWLSTETIASATFVPDSNSGLTVANLGITGNVIRAQLADGNIGTWGIEVTATTNTGRVRQRTVYLVVRQN